MIARTWRGETAPSDAQAYLAHLQGAVVPELERIEGFRGMRVLRRSELERDAFVVVTLWDSMAAIERFAGNDTDIAVVPPEAQRVLARFDARVEHFEVALSEPAVR